MKKRFSEKSKAGWVIICLLLIVAGCKKNEPIPKLKANYDQVRLVANKDAYAAMRVDPTFINAWGMAFAPSGPDWVNTEETSLSFVLNTQGGDILPGLMQAVDIQQVLCSMEAGDLDYRMAIRQDLFSWVLMELFQVGMAVMWL